MQIMQTLFKIKVPNYINIHVHILYLLDVMSFLFTSMHLADMHVNVYSTIETPLQNVNTVAEARLVSSFLFSHL